MDNEDRNPTGEHLGGSALRILLILVLAWLLYIAYGGGLFCFVSIGSSCPRSSSTEAGSPSGPTATPSGSVTVSLLSSNTKQDWVNAVVAKFNTAQVKVASGRPVLVQATHGTSGGTKDLILDGKAKPAAWSPGDQSWIDTANQVWKDKTGKPLVAEPCKPTVYAPIGFAMWRPMAEALGWPSKPISWNSLIQLAADAQGWAKYGHPEWGSFKFGHTHPDYSNSGMLIITALAYSTLGETSGLTVEQAKSQPVVDAMHTVEQNTYHYGMQSRDLLLLMVRRGPSYLHAANTTEAELLKVNRENKGQMQFPLAFIFPAGGTFWTEQPYCILAADWVTPEQAEGAKLFQAYLLAPEQQAMTIDGGLRPIDASIALHDPISLENGSDPSVTTKAVPALVSPSADASNAVKDIFHETKKKATVIVALDTSGSMQGEKIKTATVATANFLKRLEKKDEIQVIAFSTQHATMSPSGAAGEVAEELATRVQNLYADGNTSLYDTVCAGIQQINTMRTAHEAASEKRLYGLVVLSDGQDTNSQKSVNDMFHCLPQGEDVEGTKVFTIAFGGDADTSLLCQMATRTNGKCFTSDPDSIEKVYQAISAEQ